MVRPVQSSGSVISTPIEPSTVNPLYKDQFAISSLTQAATSRKSIIILGFLAVATVLIVLWRKLPSVETVLITLWRKLFPTEPVPTEIQGWVNQNCTDLNADHQQKVASGIFRTKKKIDRTLNPNVGEIIDSIVRLNPGCYRCGTVKTYVLRYFEAHPIVSTEQTSLPLPDQEIRTWLLRRYRDIPEEVLVQVIQRVHQIERLPACSENPKALIRRLRTESISSTNSDPVQLKALAFLSLKYNVMGK